MRLVYKKVYNLDVMLHETVWRWDLIKIETKYTHDGGATFIEYTLQSEYDEPNEIIDDDEDTRIYDDILDDEDTVFMGGVAGGIHQVANTNLCARNDYERFD